MKKLCPFLKAKCTKDCRFFYFKIQDCSLAFDFEDSANIKLTLDEKIKDIPKRYKSE